MNFCHLLYSLSDDLHQKVIHSIEQLTIGMIEGIIDIQAERDSRDESDDVIPDVLPHELIKMSTAEYGRRIVDPHLLQLQLTWNPMDIAEIENEHKALCKTYVRELSLKFALDAV